MADFGASLVATRISWTYVDPNAGEALRGNEIGEYVEETIQGSPDVHFEEDRVMQTEIEGEFVLVVERTMHGTHDGPLIRIIVIRSRRADAVWLWWRTRLQYADPTAEQSHNNPYQPVVESVRPVEREAAGYCG